MSDTKLKRKPSELRSQQWFGRQDRDGFAYRSWVKEFFGFLARWLGHGRVSLFVLLGLTPKW